MEYITKFNFVQYQRKIKQDIISQTFSIKQTACSQTPKEFDICQKNVLTNGARFESGIHIHKPSLAIKCQLLLLS